MVTAKRLTRGPETQADVTLDANHPLAGETLIFDIELVVSQVKCDG